MEKKTILDRQAGRISAEEELQEGIGAFWPRGHASRRTQQQQDIRFDPPDVPIPSSPHYVAPIQPVKDAAATQWFPFPPTPNAREPFFRL